MNDRPCGGRVDSLPVQEGRARRRRDSRHAKSDIRPAGRMVCDRGFRAMKIGELGDETQRAKRIYLDFHGFLAARKRRRRDESQDLDRYLQSVLISRPSQIMS